MVDHQFTPTFLERYDEIPPFWTIFELIPITGQGKWFASTLGLEGFQNLKHLFEKWNYEDIFICILGLEWTENWTENISSVWPQCHSQAGQQHTHRSQQTCYTLIGWDSTSFEVTINSVHSQISWAEIPSVHGSSHGTSFKIGVPFAQPSWLHLVWFPSMLRKAYCPRLGSTSRSFHALLPLLCGSLLS